VKGIWLFVAGMVCGIVLMAMPRIIQHIHGAIRGHEEVSSVHSERVHTDEKFAFTANAAMQQVAPLFGAEKERVWAPDWNPQFIHPWPAGDEAGMVFAVAHQHLKTTWVNTEYDTKDGRFQYVYLIPDTMVTMITIRLTPQENKTWVDVDYQRTALSQEANSHVRHMAEGDRNARPDWDKWMNGYLAKAASR
jgi:hypothetical protein